MEGPAPHGGERDGSSAPHKWPSPPSSPSLPFLPFFFFPLLFYFFSPCPRGAERGRRAAPVLRMALSATPPSAHSSSRITAGCQRNYGFGARVLQPARAASLRRPWLPAPPVWGAGAAGGLHPITQSCVTGWSRADEGTACRSPASLLHNPGSEQCRRNRGCCAMSEPSHLLLFVSQFPVLPMGEAPLLDAACTCREAESPAPGQRMLILAVPRPTITAAQPLRGIPVQFPDP